MVDQRVRLELDVGGSGRGEASSPREETRAAERRPRNRPRIPWVRLRADARESILWVPCARSRFSRTTRGHRSRPRHRRLRLSRARPGRSRPRKSPGRRVASVAASSAPNPDPGTNTIPRFPSEVLDGERPRTRVPRGGRRRRRFSGRAWRRRARGGARAIGGWARGTSHANTARVPCRGG